MPFMPSGGNISRQSLIWHVTPSAPRSSRPSLIEGVAPSSTWPRLFLLCCSNVWELSPFSQKLPSERQRRGRGDQLWGVPGGHVPLSAPVAAHDRGAAWARQEGETEMCVCRSERMPAIILIHLCQRWQQCVCLSAVLFNMHDTDNDGMITLEEYRHVSLCSETKCCLRWSFPTVFFTVLLSINVHVIAHKAFGTAGEMENENGWK